MRSDSETAIEVAGLRMRYGAVDVLHDVTFTVRSGEVLCLLGPNGAGKTTTIEILEGFRIPTAGRAKVLGSDPATGSEQWRARVGVVLQSWRDHARWRVRELLAHLGTYYGPYSTADIHRPWDVDELIAAVGLTEHAHKKLKQLSGGQRRRVDVAIGMVGRPDVLFLDEPTAGLDPVARRAFHGLIRRIADEARTTILLTTHDLGEAEQLASRIMILDGGRIIADGTTAELAHRIAGSDEVRWMSGGTRHVETTADSTAFARELFRSHGDGVSELEIKRASLEATYLALVRSAESDVEGAAR